MTTLPILITHLTKFAYNLEIFVSDERNTFIIQLKNVRVLRFGELLGGCFGNRDRGELRGRVSFTGGLRS